MPLTGAGLGHRFAGNPPLFENLDFVMEAGKVYALTGPSGSGKSTLLSIMAGWLEPAAGTLDRQGVRRTAWVFQNPHGVPRRTAIDHVALPYLAAGFNRLEATVFARERLREVGLSDVAESRFSTLSGGEGQRLMLARAVATGADLLLVDEPTAQLDPRTADAVNTAISAMSVADTIVVVATHDPRTRDACDVVLNLGDAR